MMLASLVAASLCLLLTIAPADAKVEGHSAWNSFVFFLPADEEVCFYEEFKLSRSYVAEYKVIHGGKYDVDIVVRSPNGKKIYSRDDVHADKFTFESGLGIHSFCFRNEFAMVADKKVFFSLASSNPPTLAEEAGDHRPQVLTFMGATVENIHQFMESVQLVQRDYLLREAVDRSFADSLSERVMMWSSAQACVIIVVLVTQTCVLKYFFTPKRDRKPMTSEVEYAALSDL
ncbi:PREDICTED: transmembrane emp24 domain-containing protein 3-like [Priapulus caudatus]|uniref:Transmembrane emp24 domain-containing protein 3-like n=1 Tax=Priapulus caudatus TaxID=37621 RepID=A0ABM1ECG2_PRICU|nr:PREDICTED: transmembrane emp24 domain-containing protein 3-like [Priapulus caudatus]